MMSIGEVLAGAGFGPAPPVDTPALKAGRKEALRNKLARFVYCRLPDGAVEAFWSTQMGDDPVLAQDVFDRVDKWMRREGWDDMREWKARHDIGI